MLRVRHDAASASVVRRAITDDLSGHDISRESCDDVVLVASELVGNAVTHVDDRGDLDVEWDYDGDAIVLSVRDASVDRPELRHAEPSATSGRGLAIVAAIAAEWGVTELGDGKRVWARIVVRRTS